MTDRNLTQAAVARAELRRLGIPVDSLSDRQAVELWGRFLRERVPSPPIRAGSAPVNARAWATAALTAGGFVAPEDRRQLAAVDDGGPDIDLGVIGILVMRHLNRSGSRPRGWTDAALAVRVPNGNPADFSRAQTVIDQAAQDAGIPATPKPRWWVTT